MNIIIFLCILFIIYIFWVNLYVNLKEKFSNSDCQGGWLPWQKTQTMDCSQVTGLPLDARSYKIIKEPESNGSDCPFPDGKRQEIPCNNPRPDDCLEIRARYYGSSNPTDESKKNKCNMKNCIPPTNMTANCDGGFIGEGENISKRCPWVCDPKKKLQGDGINRCSYDTDCAKCSPRKLFDRTNCGEKVDCPNPMADDGCGYYNIIDTDFSVSENPIILDEKVIIDEEIKQDYSKYIKPIKKKEIYNKYNLQTPSPSPLYKGLYDYIPFNSMHSFF